MIRKRPYAKLFTLILISMNIIIANSQIAAQIKKSSSTEKIISIKNSDKIVMVGSSYVSGCAIKGKHFTDIASSFSDYQFYNFGKSGDNLVGIMNRIRKNKGGKIGITGIKDWNATYAVVSNFENNLTNIYTNEDYYYYNMKSLCSELEALGIKPILSLEYGEIWIQSELNRLAKERGYKVINEGAFLEAVTDYRFPPFNINHHPSTRTAASRAMALVKHLSALPRPKQSIKIFRPRPNINTANKKNLLYDGIHGRLKRFAEINVGHTGLPDSKAKYFDRMSTHYNSVSHKSEYEKLLINQPVQLGDNALVEITVPCTSKNLKSFKLEVKGKDINKVYLKRCLGLKDYYSPKKTYIQFRFTSSKGHVPKAGEKFKLISTGNDYDFQVDNTVYTIEKIIKNKIITNIKKGNKITSGLNKFDTSMPGVKIKGSYCGVSISDPYFKNLKKPLGDWFELKNDGQGNWLVPPEQFVNSMQYDKLAFLMTGKNISITDVYALYSGIEGKNYRGKTIEQIKKGPEMLANTLLDDNCKAWENISSITVHKPVKTKWRNKIYTEKKPLGINTIRIISGNDKLVQDLPRINKSLHGCEVQIRILCRYFPEYVDSDEKYNPASDDCIKIDSYDFAELQVEIWQDKNNTIVPPAKAISEPVALWWHEIVLTTKLPQTKNSQLIISAPGRPVQIAQVKVVRTN
jgi:hypothetical protein